jgi:hypothetical protein
VGNGGVVYVYRSSGLVALVPPDVMTVTSTVPDPGGDEAVTTVPAPFTAKVDAGFPGPKSTARAPVRLVPVIVTVVPLVAELGVTPATVGNGGRL